MGKPDVRVAWRPNPGPQADLLACPCDEILYGGARGGGKTDGVLIGKWLQHATRNGAASNGLVLRKALAHAEDTIARCKAVFLPMGARFNEGKSRFDFPNGARLRFAYLRRDKDAENYQGHGYSFIAVEELTQFAEPGPIMKLKASLRGVARPLFVATTNPGGPGHGWVKRRYVDAAPPMTPIWEHGQSRVFIPAKLRDNPALLGADPGYADRLRGTGNAALVRAWLDGDWSVIEGAFFDRWRAERHVCAPFRIPAHWTRIRSFDWGSASPFSVGWQAVVSEPTPIAGGRTLPRNALVRYREWYGADAEGAGLRLTAERIADGIVAREKGEPITIAVADGQIFDQISGPTIAQRMAQRGVNWRRADKRRVGGWDQLRQRLDGEDDAHPGFVVFDTCRDTIRTLPALQHDLHDPEDVDSDGEDHAADELRYACMARPWAARTPRPRLDDWTPPPMRIADLAPSLDGERERRI